MNKNILDTILITHRQVDNLLKHRLNPQFTDADIIEFYREAEKLSLTGNAAIAERIIEYYQLLDEDEHLVDEAFAVISLVYDMLLSIRPYDITLRESAFFFFLNVMDDVEKAKGILEAGISSAQTKISNLQQELDKM